MDDIDELIDINAAILTRLLERVVAHRQAIETQLKRPVIETVSKPYEEEKARYGKKNSVLDLVEEVIPFAPFLSCSATKGSSEARTKRGHTFPSTVICCSSCRWIQ